MFKSSVDELPDKVQVNKRVLMKEMSGKVSAAHSCIFMFSVRDYMWTPWEKRLCMPSNMFSLKHVDIVVSLTVIHAPCTCMDSWFMIY